MIGLKRGTVVLEKYTDEWKDNAKWHIKQLKKIFGDIAIDIQHVGSTSVEGLMSKPIIDILVGVDNFKSVQELIPLLEENGYIHKQENDNEYHMFFSCGDFENDIRTHHIHVDIYGDEEWNNYIKFRDALINNDELLKEYEKLKIRLCKDTNGRRSEYTKMKSEFIKNVLNKC